MTIEHRRVRGIQIRAVDDGGANRVRLQLIAPNVVDDYGTVWDAHSLDVGLGERLPVLCWSHDWGEPLGRGLDFDTSDDGPQVLFEFDDFDAVPMARRAHAQLLSGTIQDCSIGFSRVHGGTLEPTDKMLSDWPGIREYIEQAIAEETSLVIRGAVPGAKVLAVRSAAGTVQEVSQEFVLDLARKVNAGEITQEEAQIAVGLAGGVPTPPTTGEPSPEQAEAQAAAIAEAEQLLADTPWG